MGLIVALDDYERANGDLFWDEGDTAGKLISITILQEYGNIHFGS